MEETLSRRERKKLKREEARQEQASESSKSELFKKLGFVGAVILAAVVVWFGLQSGSKNENVSESAPSGNISEINSSDHTKGNQNALVKIVEYSDFQCPACKAYEPLLSLILGANPETVSVTYRHFPLRSIHRHAQIAAQAAEAASIQGKFWEMHDKLFETQQDWSVARDPRSRFVDYAKEIGLDAAKFESDMNSSEIKNIVDDAYNTAVSLNINSTPTIYINGEKVSPPRSESEFQGIINQIVSESQVTEASNSGEIQE